MNFNKLTISDLVDQQLPDFVVGEFPKFVKFFEEYYKSLEISGGLLDITNNFLDYKNVDNLRKYNLVTTYKLTQNISTTDTSIILDGLDGLPSQNGLISIGDEIIFYESVDLPSRTLLNCERGYTATTSLSATATTVQTSVAASHELDDTVTNLSNLILFLVLRNYEKQYLAGFPFENISTSIDKDTLVTNIKDFYNYKGTDVSIEFLFRALYDEEVTVKYPKDYVIKSSYSDFTVDDIIKVEAIEGNPYDLIGNELSQTDASGSVITTAVIDQILVNNISNYSSANKNIFEIRLNVLNKQVFNIPKESILRGTLDSTSSVITVDSTIGFSQLNGIIQIDDEVITYRYKTFNQFIDCGRGAYNTVATNHADLADIRTTEYLYGYSEGLVDDTKKVSMRLLGVLSSVTLDDGGAYYEESERVTLSEDGDTDLRQQFTSWRKNETGTFSSSSDIQIDANVNTITTEVSNIYKDDNYAYIVSSGLPGHPIGDFIGVGFNVNNQNLLKTIPLSTEKNTQTQFTGNRAVGLFINGVEAFSAQDYEDVSYGNIESVQIIQPGFGFDANIQPVFRITDATGSNASFSATSSNGKVTSISVVNGGNGYTADRTLEVTYGFDATASIANDTDIINGSIRTITVTNPGQDYVATPNVEIIDSTGKGTGAFAIAEITNNQLTGVIILNGGVDYSDRSTITVNIVSKGTGVVAKTVVKKWSFDRVFKTKYSIDQNGNYALAQQIKSDTSNGYLYQSRNIAYNLQYAYPSNPKILRHTLSDNVQGVNANYDEKTSGFVHSPILGWAYDGNPIYGPYGYSNPVVPGSGIARQTSSYSLLSTTPATRPSTTQYPLGSFVDDYEFVQGSGSLDINNGRFCVTPEYPDGRYCYFITVNNFGAGVYPYIIGTTYYSVPSENNFNIEFNQQDENNLPTEARRIRTASTPSKGFDAILSVSNVQRGSVDSFVVNQSENIFKTLDYLYIDGTDTEGSRAFGRVNSVKGPNVPRVSYQVSAGFTHPQLTTTNGIPDNPWPVDISAPYLMAAGLTYDITVETSTPHLLSDGDNITLELDRNALSLARTFKVRVSNYQTINYVKPVIETTLVVDVAFNQTTINVDNSDDYRENDYLKVNDEILKITSINYNSDQITVERTQFGSSLRLHAATNKVELYIPDDQPDYRLTVGSAITSSGVSGTIYSIDKETSTIEVRIGSGTLSNSSTITDTSSPTGRTVNISSVGNTQVYWEFDVTNTGNHYVRDISFRLIRGTEYTFDTSDGSIFGNNLIFSEDSANINTLTGVTYTGTPGTAGSTIVISKNALLNFDVSRVYYYEQNNQVLYNNKFFSVLTMPDGIRTVKVINDNSFKFVIPLQPEQTEYLNVISYSTTSTTAIGEINSVAIVDGGEGYKKLPEVSGIIHSQLDDAKFTSSISSGSFNADITVVNPGSRYSSNTKLIVNTSTGSGAILIPTIVNGRIISVRVDNPGNGYSDSDIILALDTGAKIFPISSSIGKIKTIRFNNNGSQFNPDRTFSKTLVFKKKVIITNISGGVYKLSENVSTSSGVSAKIEKINKIGVDIYLLDLKINAGNLKVGDTLIGSILQVTSEVYSITNPDITGNIGGFISKVGFFDSDLGKLSASSQKITDSYYYQDFSYVIRSTKSLSDYKNYVDETTHPLGFKLFGEVSVENDVDFDDTVTGNPFSIGLADDHSANEVIITLPNINVESDIVFKKYEISTLNTANLKSYPGVGAARLNFLDNQIEAVQIADISSQLDETTQTYTLTTNDGNFPTATFNTSVLLSLNEVFQEPIQTATVTGITYVGGLATITTGSDHNLATTSAGQTYPNQKYIHISGVTNTGNLNFNDQFEVYDVPSSDTLRVVFDNPNGFLTNTDPAVCADVKSTIDNLVSILTYQLNDPTRALPANNTGVWLDPAESTVVSANRHRDGANLIDANRFEIIDRANAEISLQYPDFYYPNDPQTSGYSRYKDAYRLIQLNRQEIIDDAFAEIAIQYPSFTNPNSDKCKRDLGIFIDAVSLDVHTGGNVYSRKFLKKYFNAQGSSFITNGLSGEILQSITAFNKARDLMKEAITNQLTVTDLTITPGNASYWGPAVGTPTDVTYDASTGVSVITIANHGLSNGEEVKIKDNGLTFTCGMDGNVAEKSYPRLLDGNSNTAMTVSNVTTDTFEINVGSSPIVNFNVTDATYTPITGDVELTIGSHSLRAGTSIKLRDESLVFTCDFDNNQSEHSYPKTTILSETIENADYDPANGILTVTVNNHGWEEGDLIKFDDNSVVFTCDRDGNQTQHSYPRPGSDPYAGKWIPIYDVYEDTFKVAVGVSSDTSAHTFISATTNGLKKKKDKVYDTAVNIMTVTATTITINVGSSTDNSVHTFVPGSSLSNAVISGGDYPHTFVRSITDAIVRTQVSSVVPNNDPGACFDVQSNIDNLAYIVTFYLDQGSLNYPTPLPIESMRVLAAGEGKCKRDLGYIIDAVIGDMRTGGNSNIRTATEFYLDGNSLLTNGVAGEVDESITAFEKARDLMKLAIANQLYETDLTILPDFLTTSGTISSSHLTDAIFTEGQFEYTNATLKLYEEVKEGTTFYSTFLKFVSAGDDTRYSYKIKNILFDGISKNYPLSKIDGTNVTTEADENLLVFIDGVLQIYGESYTIDRSVNPNIIKFTTVIEKDRHFFAYTFSKYKILNNFADEFNSSKKSFEFKFGDDNILPPDDHQMLVMLDGIPQVEGSSYTIVDNVISFTEAPTTGKQCFVLYFYGKVFDKTISIWNGEVFEKLEYIGENSPEGCRYLNKVANTGDIIKPGDKIKIDGETTKEIIRVEERALENTDNLVYTALVYTDNSYIRGKNAVANATIDPTNNAVSGGNPVGIEGTMGVEFTMGIPTVFAPGPIDGINITNPGLEYDVAPIILFKTECDNPGTGAEAYAEITNGKVTNIVITNPGSGYTEPPELIFAKKYEIIRPQTPLYMKNNTIVDVSLASVSLPGFNVVDESEVEGIIPLVSTQLTSSRVSFIETEIKTNRDTSRPGLSYVLETFDNNKFSYEPHEPSDPLASYLGTGVTIEMINRYAPALTVGDFTTHRGATQGATEPAIINIGPEAYVTYGFTLPNGASTTDTIIQIDGSVNNVPSSGLIEFGDELIDAERISGPTTPGVQAVVDVTGVGYIDSVTVSNAGAGYETAPTVSVTSPSGTDATITANLTTSGSFKRFDITSGGSNYTYPPIITLGGGMSGTNATAEITAGVLTGISLDGVTYNTTNSNQIFEFGNGTSIVQNGTGSGSLGGFDIGGSHLRFGGANGTRFATLNAVDTTNADTVRVYAIRGTGSNGGETPDVVGTEDLVLQYQTTAVGTDPDNASWITLGIIIDAVPNGQGTGVLDNYDFDISSTPGAINSNTWFRLYQAGNSGAGFDHYGILSVSFLDIGTAYTDSTVTISNNPLDSTGSGATADVYLNKEVASLTLADGGTGYAQATVYNLVFSGGNPTSTAIATGDAVFEFDISIVNAGESYDTATVTFTGGGGSNLTALLTVDPNTTGISNAVITNQGSGYTSIPSFQVSAPDDVWNYNHIKARTRGANGTTASTHAAEKYVRLAWRG